MSAVFTETPLHCNVLVLILEQVFFLKFLKCSVDYEKVHIEIVQLNDLLHFATFVILVMFIVYIKQKLVSSFVTLPVQE